MVKMTTGLARRMLLLPRGVAEGAIVGASMLGSLIATMTSFHVFQVPLERWAATLTIALGVPLFVATPVAVVVMRLLRALDQARQEAHRLGGIDMLTGMLNRRRWAEQAERELRRARHMHGPLSVLLLDVDNFKQINDRYGHGTGDEVLKAVASVCSNTLRPGDSVARWGGEEFVALLPGTSDDGALLAAERVRAAVAANRVANGDQSLQVTASIGVADARDANYDLQAVVHLADQAMYLAKQSGKNRALAAVRAEVPAANDAAAPAEGQSVPA